MCPGDVCPRCSTCFQRGPAIEAGSVASHGTPVDEKGYKVLRSGLKRFFLNQVILASTPLCIFTVYMYMLH